MAFHVIIFNSMEFYDGLSPSIIPSVMCLIFFKNQIQINKLEKNLKKNKTKIKELNKGNNIPIFFKNKISSISFIYIKDFPKFMYLQICINK